MNNLILKYNVEVVCDDCGEEIEELRWYNEQGQEAHVTTHTAGHYYIDGGVRCEGCHESSK